MICIMFGWIFRKKGKAMEKDIKDASSPDGLSKEIMSKVKLKRQFEIFVEEYTEGDVGCQAGWRPVHIDSKLGGNGGNPVITVTSQADLQEKLNFYKQLGQRFRIVREIDPPSEEDFRKAAIEQGLLKDENNAVQAETAQAPAPGASASRPDKCQKKAERPPAAQVEKPKIITIGDVQIKYDGDKVYQKQWVRLTPAESSNFRVVSDSSNKIVSMNGKHLEAKRWILVENEFEEDDRTEEMINA